VLIVFSGILCFLLNELCIKILIKICSLTFLDRRIAAGMPSSRGEDWQPLLMYRNSLVHGETDQPPVTSKRAYSRKKKDYAGKLFFADLSE
jgi:cohesin complex subunit SA-1/2